MRVLFVSPEVPDRGGAGIATYLDEATLALSDRGHECHVLTWSADVDSEETSTCRSYVLHEVPVATFDVEGLDSGLLASSALADKILRLHGEHRFDLIEGSDWGGPLYCLLQRRNVERVLDGCLITIFNHGVTYNIARHKSSFTPRSVYQTINLEHQCLALADAVICPSTAAARSLHEVHGVAMERMVVVPEPIRRLHRTHVPDATHPAILFYGSVCPSKGLREFSFIAKRVRLFHPEWPVEFIGPMRVPVRDRALFAEEIIEQLGASERDVLFSGQLSREDALARIGGHHVHINMSRRETFCYAFIEALLCGATPVTLPGTPQAEFLPPHLRRLFTTGTSSADLDVFDVDTVRADWERFGSEVQDYATARSSPSGYADAYERLVGRGCEPRVVSMGKWINAPVSVLIPAHEPNEHLLETVESVLAQEVAPLEIVIGDDGSRQSRSRDILHEVAGHRNVRVVSFAWRGLAATRNRLLRECRTPLFAFVDADDLLMPSFMSKSRQYLGANYDEGVRSVQSWYELFGSQTGRRGPVIFQHFSHALWNDLKNNIMGVTETFRDLGYDEELRSGEAEDWEFWLRYFRHGWQVRVVPEVLWRYRRHKGAISARWSEPMSLGTARANARILGAGKEGIPAHVWEFIGEYMYLGESFFHPDDERAFLRPPCKDQRKIESRLSSLRRRTGPRTLRQRAALRFMRHLSKSLA